MGGQTSSEQSPNSSQEDIAGQLPSDNINSTSRSRAIKGGGRGGSDVSVKDALENTHTPSSLTDRVKAMVNPHIPEAANIHHHANMHHSSRAGASNEAKPTMIETVPTAFKWGHGGDRVFVTGSFNNWQGKIMMHRSDDNSKEFVLVIDIPPGTHQYKFIVDDEWRLNPDSPKVTSNGVNNNVVEVKRPVFENIASPFGDSDDEDVDEAGRPVQYSQLMPAESTYGGNPPKAPPHLGQSNITLNKPTIIEADPFVLDVPGHELLNHVIVNGQGDEHSEVLITSITQRFRTKASISVTPKFVTLIFYKPNPSGLTVVR